jgi:hypothetical protein
MYYVRFRKYACRIRWAAAIAESVSSPGVIADPGEESGSSLAFRSSGARERAPANSVL